MTSTTTTPATLHEYQDFVRKEALKIQVDMGWPDEKLNATLRALGLPEKLTYYVPVEVTSKALVLVKIDDALSEEEARASVAERAGADLPAFMRQQPGMGGSYRPEAATLLDALPEPEEGALDSTMSNPSVAAARRGTRYCETYDSTGRHYCTRVHGHDGIHAYGNGMTVVATWPRS